MKSLLVLALGGLTVLTACAPSENAPNDRGPTALAEAMKVVEAPGLSISGPTVGMGELEHHFVIVPPAGLTVASTKWLMGDGSAAVTTVSEVDHTYTATGTFTVTATVLFTNGDSSLVSTQITVLPYVDGMECVRDLAVTVPTSVLVGTPISASVTLPLCLSSRVSRVDWSFGDATPLQSGTSVTHTFVKVGVYTYTVQFYPKQGSAALFSFSRSLTVSPLPVPPPPTPADPLACPKEGDTRDLSGTSYEQERSCGVGGHQTIKFQDTISQECRKNSAGQLRWTEVSRRQNTVSEESCQDVACELPAEALSGVDASTLGLLLSAGKAYLPHGSKKTFYSSLRPNGSCAEVAVVRECSNGVLSGTSDNPFLSCVNGCAGVGPDGTKITVATGEEQVARACSFGETGIFDTYNVLTDKTCQNGQVSVDNSRRGVLLSAGACPTYQWTPSEKYTSCTAACGGEQTQIFECRDDKGALATSERCVAEAPLVKRACDGDPESVRKTESETTTEDAGSSEKCPADQIGVIQSEREVTVTKTYACVDHAVALESTNTQYGPWVSEKTCRDFVAHRCNHDSLSIDQAKARLQWMEKCRSQVPEIEKFLSDYKSNIRGEGEDERMVYKRRYVYATFMDRAGQPEKPWIAPKKVSGSCVVPETAYVAAVCVASCATPEQMILAKPEAKGRLEYVTFEKAWNEKFKFVATMASQSSMSSKFVQKTRVDDWVTELVDSDHEIIQLTMKSGGTLRLTPNHPLVTEEGALKAAEDFKVGDRLVRHGGGLDPIVALMRETYHGKVYNVFVKSADVHKNVVLTNGYLNGTAFFQNEGAKLLNRRLLRDQLLRGVFQK